MSDTDSNTELVTVRVAVARTEVKQHRMEIVVLYQLIPILGMTQKERRGAIRIIVRSCDLVRY